METSFLDSCTPWKKTIHHINIYTVIVYCTQKFRSNVIIWELGYVPTIPQARTESKVYFVGGANGAETRAWG